MNKYNEVFIVLEKTEIL